MKRRIENLPLDALKSDPHVQRSVIAARVNHIARSFDPEGMGVIVVSQRDDGYYLVDGQHRVEAARTLGKPNMRVKCLVYSGLTRDDEASIFLLLNDARAVSAIDKYRIGLVAGDETVEGVEAILKEFGLRVGAGGDGLIGCPDVLLKLYRRGPDLLRETLQVALDAWGVRSAATERLTLDGLSLVLGKYNGELDRAALVRKLSKYRGGPAGVIADAKALSEIKPITKSKAVGEIVVGAYNHGRRSGALSPLS